MGKFIDISDKYHFQMGFEPEPDMKPSNFEYSLVTILGGGIQVSLRYDMAVNDYACMVSDLNVPFPHRIVYVVHSVSPTQALAIMLAYVASEAGAKIPWSTHKARDDLQG